MFKFLFSNKRKFYKDFYNELSNLDNKIKENVRLGNEIHFVDEENSTLMKTRRISYSKIKFSFSTGKEFIISKKEFLKIMAIKMKE